MAHEAEVRAPIGLRSWLILGVGLGTLGLVAAVLGVVWLFQQSGGLRRTIAPPTRFAPPQLQSDPAGDLRDYQAAQRARLEGYAWADRERGLVRIPVARAMEIIAGRGTGAYAPLDPPQDPEPAR
jgi:hypothetical protein